MIKHFCDECGMELTIQEIVCCNEMIGTKKLCTEHIHKYIEEEPTKYSTRGSVELMSK